MELQDAKNIELQSVSREVGDKAKDILANKYNHITNNKVTVDIYNITIYSKVKSESKIKQVGDFNNKYNMQ